MFNSIPVTRNKIVVSFYMIVALIGTLISVGHFSNVQAQTAAPTPAPTTIATDSPAVIAYNAGMDSLKNWDI